MNQHILIIDDEAPIRELLARFLTMNGYRLTTAGLALEALRTIEADAPDLIICDLQLEDADGLELIGQLKQSLPNTPVILLTGVLFDPQVARGLVKEHVACYLGKPTSLQDILHSVRELLK